MKCEGRSSKDEAFRSSIFDLRSFQFIKRERRAHSGMFTLLEIVPVVSIILVLAGVIYFTMNPVGNFEKSRNEVRRGDLVMLADAIGEYGRDKGMDILLQVPMTATEADALEICADTKTQMCAGKLDLNALMGTYLNEVPRDPNIGDENPEEPQSGYFIHRTDERHFRIFADQTEPTGTTKIEVRR